MSNKLLKTKETYIVYYRYINQNGYWINNKTEIDLYSDDKNLKCNHELAEQLFMKTQVIGNVIVDKIVYV